jgi:hypothetical protein
VCVDDLITLLLLLLLLLCSVMLLAHTVHAWGGWFAVGFFAAILVSLSNRLHQVLH